MGDITNPWRYPRQKIRTVRNNLILRNGSRVERLAASIQGDLIQVIYMIDYPEDSKAKKLVDQIKDRLNSEYPDERLENKIYWSNWRVIRDVVDLIVELIDEIEEKYWEHEITYEKEMLIRNILSQD